ncbi:hypothetical protein OROHE_018864 [Orobanche hederae]
MESAVAHPINTAPHPNRTRYGVRYLGAAYMLPRKPWIKQKRKYPNHLGCGEGAYKEIWSIIDAKVGLLDASTLACGCILSNPYYQYDDDFSTQPEVKVGRLTCTAKLYPDLQVQEKLIFKWMFFVDLWLQYGDEKPELQGFAVRILSLTCSLSVCERNWSTFNQRMTTTLVRALEEKKLVLAEAKKAERAAMQSFQDKTATFEAYTKACKKISKHCAQMQALQEQVISAKKVDKDVKVLKNKLSDEGVLIKSLDAKLAELQSKVYYPADWLKESKKQLEKERALTHEDVDKEFKKVQMEVDAKRNSLQLRHRQVELLVAEADAMNVKRKTVNDETKAKMLELNRKYEEVFLEFENYSKSIDNLLAGSGAER